MTVPPLQTLHGSLYGFGQVVGPPGQLTCQSGLRTAEAEGMVNEDGFLKTVSTYDSYL